MLESTFPLCCTRAVLSWMSSRNEKLFRSAETTEPSLLLAETNDLLVCALRADRQSSSSSLSPRLLWCTSPSAMAFKASARAVRGVTPFPRLRDRPRGDWKHPRCVGGTGGCVAASATAFAKGDALAGRCHRRHAARSPRDRHAPM